MECIEVNKQEDVYGPHLLLDVHNCDVSSFSRAHLEEFCIKLCELIGMDADKFVPWDDDDIPIKDHQVNPKTTGYSCVQFILTSGIVIHALTKIGKLYIDIFSCKEFDTNVATNFVQLYFGGTVISSHLVWRI